jgi:steroid delta-isomerase
MAGLVLAIQGFLAMILHRSAALGDTDAYKPPAHATLVRMLRVAIVLLAFLVASPALAGDKADIAARLAGWASDFNAGKADRVCDLFSKDLVADIQGAAPGRTYDEQCAILRRALADKSKSFTYQPVIHDITVLGDTAIVRLDWQLTTKLSMRPDPIRSAEIGMDIFRREPDGTWRIIRFLAYDAQ